MTSQGPLRIGFVPEHFSTPLYFAQKHFALNAILIPFPSGTGHMITALRAAEIDVGIGLTEGWVAGLGKDNVKEEGRGDGGYRLVGSYVDTPLCTLLPHCFFLDLNGEKRADIHNVQVGQYQPVPIAPISTVYQI
jgi:hypothetical protein